VRRTLHVCDKVISFHAPAFKAFNLGHFLLKDIRKEIFGGALWVARKFDLKSDKFTDPA